MDDPYRVALVKEQARKLAQENQYAIMGTPWLLFPFERAFAMQGMDKFLLNMAMNPDFAKALLRKITDLCKTLMGHFLGEAGDNLDIIKIGDDLGTQEKLMISPRMYRQILKPFHAEFIEFIKARTKAKVFFHTDGDVFDLIEDFVEMGVDILNPIQTSAGKMANLSELKERMG
jgi:uroporphyrinogen decarboxylase